jgi:hypothetical protein
LVVGGWWLVVGPSQFDVEFCQRVESTKAKISASELRAIAVAFFSTNANPWVTPHPLVPERISSLPFFDHTPAREINAHTYSGNQSNFVLVGFQCGGGFEYRGIFITVGDARESKKILDGFVGTMVPWEEGVYFWADWWVRGIPKEYWNNYKK